MRERYETTSRWCAAGRVQPGFSPASPTTTSLSQTTQTHFRNEICEIVEPTPPPTAPVSTSRIRGILKTTHGTAGRNSSQESRKDLSLIRTWSDLARHACRKIRYQIGDDENLAKFSAKFKFFASKKFNRTYIAHLRSFQITN